MFAGQKAPLSTLAQGGKVSKENIATPVFGASRIEKEKGDHNSEVPVQAGQFFVN